MIHLSRRASCAAIDYHVTMPERIRTAELDWEDVRYFVALARHGSLSAAARALRVNHATVARRIAGLEATLGRSLFDRRASGYALTGDGKAVHDEALAMERAAVGVLDRAAAGTAIRGLVRLTTIRSLADYFLIDRLGALHRRHPELELEVLVEARVLSLARREADVALRAGRPADSDLLARRAGRLSFAFFASRRLARALRAGEAPPLIGYDEASTFVAEGVWLNRRFAGRRFSFRSNSHTSQAAAARAGLGVALLPRFLGAGDPALVEVEHGELPPDRELWLLVRSDLARVPRVRAVVDYVVELLRGFT
jgi:DNA-binding transcriptional LysR family regulator